MHASYLLPSKKCTSAEWCLCVYVSSVCVCVAVCQQKHPDLSLPCYRDMDRIGNTMQKKAAELEWLAEVLVTGEQLR